MKLVHCARWSAALAACSTVPLWAQQAPTTDDSATLPQVTVVGAPEAGYQPKKTSAATKGDAALIETPMAVQVIPSEVLQDRQASNSLEAVRNVSGVQGQPGSFYDQFQIRGFGSGYGVSYRNGLQLEGIADAVNMAFVDRIEIIKGPASMLYGRVEPGGFVNVVTKRPQAESMVSIEQQVGRWHDHQTTIDATGALGGDGVWTYRAIGAYQKSDDYYDFQHYDRKAASGEVAFKPSNRFDAHLGVEYYDYRSGGRGPNTVVPVIGDRPVPVVPRNYSGSDPTMWANFPDVVKRSLVSFDWTYALNDDWRLTQRFHYVYVDEIQTGLGDWGGVWGFIYNPLSRHIYNTNLDLSGRVTLGSTVHRLLFGADTYRYVDDWHGYVGATTIPVITRYDPAYVDFTSQLQALKQQALGNTLWKSLETGSGVYVQDQIALTPQWDVLLGGRWDRAYQRYALTYGAAGAGCYPNCTGEPMGNWPVDTAFSPRAAALYKLDAATSLYASYAKSFGTNNSSYLADGAYAAPEVGVQYELGLKRSLFGDRAFASATLFQLTKSNVLGPDPADRLRQIAIGEVRSRGLELDLAGRVTDTVSVITSYTYNPVKITRDTNDPSNEGHRRAGTPLNSASFWVKYDSARGSDHGWGLGAGVYLNGQRQGDDANTWQLPGYGVVDLMCAYRTRIGSYPVSAQINVKNAFDRVYYDQIGYGTVSYGAPRAVMGSVRIDL